MADERSDEGHDVIGVPLRVEDDVREVGNAVGEQHAAFDATDAGAMRFSGHVRAGRTASQMPAGALIGA
jgi:hypothetical protein